MYWRHFTIQELVREEWHGVQKQIQKMCIKDAALHSIIRDYLVSHAYTDTLAVFDKSYPHRALNPQSAPFGANQPPPCVSCILALPPLATSSKSEKFNLRGRYLVSICGLLHPEQVSYSNVPWHFWAHVQPVHPGHRKANNRRMKQMFERKLGRRSHQARHTWH